MRILTDSTQLLAVLINCTREGNFLYCGAAIFKGGLSGAINVSDNFNSYTIKIPESVAKVATKECYIDEYDSLEFEIVK